MGLLLHAGAAAISRDDIAHLSYPAPQGSRHVVKPFAESIDLVYEQLDHHGFEAQNGAFGVKFDANNLAVQLFGAIEVQPKALEGEYIPAKEYQSVVGIRASTDQTLPFGLVAGSSVFVCDNLAFSGDLCKVTTKQSTFINERIYRLVSNAIAQLPAEIEKEEQRFSAYKNKVLTKAQGDAALVEMIRKNILNTADLTTVIKEWDTPRHEEHAQHGRTVWQLFNACTEGFKYRGNSQNHRGNLPTAWNRGLALTQYLDRGVGLITRH